MSANTLQAPTKLPTTVTRSDGVVEFHFEGGARFTRPFAVLRYLAHRGKLTTYDEYKIAELCVGYTGYDPEAAKLLKHIKSRYRIWKDSNACARKVRYDDKKAAVTQINLIQDRRGEQNLRAYPCPSCRGWHLTKDDHETDQE